MRENECNKRANLAQVWCMFPFAMALQTQGMLAVGIGNCVEHCRTVASQKQAIFCVGTPIVIFWHFQKYGYHPNFVNIGVSGRNRQFVHPYSRFSLPIQKFPYRPFGNDTYTNGAYPAVMTCVVGVGGRVRRTRPGEKEMFRVGTHLLYVSHAAAVTHYKRNARVAAKKP